MSNRIRVGLVGTSHAHAAGKLAVLKQSPDFDLVGVCEADPAQRASRDKDKLFADVRWVSEEALLSDSSVQLIVVEGQVRDNVAAARRAVEAGKHVHLEKPPSMD
ncbi:MAG: gfo/Idh/MocA family oxidoreductase, partial [Planctomycetes bacterium]|nr:gfo/Idh/MocA family oxidoreductase [Planctomycetota bacterium]